MKETYQELLARQENERREWQDLDRRDKIVTLQCSSVHGGERPFSIEIVFPDNLSDTEKQRVNHDLHNRLGEVWLRELGYQFTWLPPKSDAERRQEVERLNALKKDLPQSTMAELMNVVDEVTSISDLTKWPTAACRGFEKMHRVIRAARGELDVYTR